LGLQASRIKGELHPWLRARVQFLEDLTTAWGGVFIYLSGYRSPDEQRTLIRDRAFKFSRRPIAGPGCSQHNHFGPDANTLAVDVGITGPIRDDVMAFRDFNDLIDEWARSIGLVTVSRDSGHFQVFPGSEFRSWSVASGFCDPAETARLLQAADVRAARLLEFRISEQEKLDFNISRLFRRT